MRKGSNPEVRIKTEEGFSLAFWILAPEFCSERSLWHSKR
jgi:hypothetical protein